MNVFINGLQSATLHCYDLQKRWRAWLSPRRILKAISAWRTRARARSRRLARVIERVLWFGGPACKLITSAVHWPHYVHSRVVLAVHGHAPVIGENLISPSQNEFSRRLCSRDAPSTSALYFCLSSCCSFFLSFFSARGNALDN